MGCIFIWFFFTQKGLCKIKFIPVPFENASLLAIFSKPNDVLIVFPSWLAAYIFKSLGYVIDLNFNKNEEVKEIENEIDHP